MADVPISQLPGANPLTGTEAVPVVQSGVTVQTTVGAIAAKGSTPPGGSNGQVQVNNAGVFGGLTAAQLTALINAFSSVLPGAVPASGGGVANFLRADGAWAIPSLVSLLQSGNWFQYSSDNAGSGGYGVVGGTTSLGSYGVETSPNADNPPTGTLIGAMHRKVYTSTAAINNSAGAYIFANQTQWMYTSIGASALGGGFSMYGLFAFTTARADQRAFVGIAAGVNGLGATVDPSTFLNTFGYGKDQGDVNLQLMYNGASGSATKVDTGVSFASLLNVPLVLTISAAPGGSVTLTITNMATGAVISTNTILPGDAKYVGANIRLTPVFFVNTGSATATAVTISVCKFAFTTGALMT